MNYKKKPNKILLFKKYYPPKTEKASIKTNLNTLCEVIKIKHLYLNHTTH